MSRRAITSIAIAALVAGGGTVVGRLLGYNFGGRTFVRCRGGHLFTTVWVPGLKLKALDLGIARVQRCPIGRHWSLVRPVRGSDLTEEERQGAVEHHDVWLP